MTRLLGPRGVLLAQSNIDRATVSLIPTPVGFIEEPNATEVCLFYIEMSMQICSLSLIWGAIIGFYSLLGNNELQWPISCKSLTDTWRGPCLVALSTFSRRTYKVMCHCHNLAIKWIPENKLISVPLVSAFKLHVFERLAHGPPWNSYSPCEKTIPQCLLAGFGIVLE